MMANINKVFLLPPTDRYNYISYKSENNNKKGNNIFRFFDKNLHINVLDDNIYIHKLKKKNKTKKFTIQTNFSTDIKKTYFTDINKSNTEDYIIKSKGIKAYKSSKKINLNRIHDLLFQEKNQNLEENKNNLNIISSENKKNKEKKSQKKKIIFTNERLSSFYKDMLNLKMNLKNSKNFSLYKKKNSNQLTKSTQIPSKKIIKEYKYKNLKVKNKFFLPNKTKYIYIKQEIIPLTKFNDLPDNVKKMNKYYMNSVKFESNKFFGNNFSLLRKEKFSAQYRNPLLNNNLLSDDIKIIKEEKYKKIREDIIAGKAILNEINKGNNKIVVKNLINIKTIFFKFKKWIIRFAEAVKFLSIKPILYIQIVYKFNTSKDLIFYETQHRKTGELIKALKSKNKNLSLELVEEYPYIILGKDYLEYTPLHWAVKQKFYDIIPDLILYGSYPSARNFNGDTPLHSAVKNNDYESTVLLLIFMANPFIKNNKGRKPFDLVKDYQMNMIKKRIEHLYYINTFKRSITFINNIRTQFIKFINDEFRLQLSKECLEIIGEIEKRKNGKKKDE